MTAINRRVAFLEHHVALRQRDEFENMSDEELDRHLVALFRKMSPVEWESFKREVEQQPKGA